MATTRTSIPRPDVRVTVTPSTTTPTTATPALPACVIGPCYQVVDPQLSAGLAANPDAQLSLPAIIRSWGNAVATGVLVQTVTVTLNVNGATVNVTFASGSAYTVAQIVTAINAALVTANASAVASATAAEVRFILRTTSTGDGQFIVWTARSAADADVSATALSITALKIPLVWRSNGTTNYDQIGHVVQFEDYPDPLDIIDELDIDLASVRLFGNLSAGLSEWHQTTTIERCGKAGVRYLDDGDGDGYTPLVLFSSPGAAPDHRHPLDVVPLAAVDVPGLTDFVAAATQYQNTFGVMAATPHAAGTLVMEVAGLEPQSIDIAAGDDAAAVVAKINDRFPTTATDTGALLVGPIDIDLSALNAGFTEAVAHGRDSYVIITGTDALLIAVFGGGAADWPMVARGTWRPLTVGAQLYVNGLFVGNVAEVLGADNVRLDREVAQTAAPTTTSDFYFVTANAAPSMAGTATNARGNFYAAPLSAADAPEGTLRIKPEILRDVSGRPMRLPYMTAGAACGVYMGYTGLRLDVTPSAADPNILNFASAVELATELAPLDTTNPLGYGLYLALLNCPGLTVYGIGVDEVSTSEPEGTLEAYTECAEFLESHIIYSLAPLTHSEDVAFMLETHVDYMSGPDLKGERILWWNPDLPTRERSIIAASGAQGNCDAIPGVSGAFNTGLADLPARMVAAGLGGGPWTVDNDRVFLQVQAFGSKLFEVLSMAGSSLTIQDYSGAIGLPFEADISLSFTTALIDEPFTIGQLGASLYTGVVYDKQKAAEAMHDLGREFINRRVRMVVPDEVIATIGGLEQTVEGYYACCCLAGMKAYYTPSMGFTNVPVAGLDRVQRTQGYFKESQLNLMAGGGAWILIPGPGGGSVVTRMDLTTDTSTVEYRQDSWTSALDYGSYYIRSVVRGIIGPTIITPESIDAVASLVDSCIKYLVEKGIWLAGSITSIAQSTTNPDTIEVGVSVQVPYVLHYVNIDITV